MTEEGHRDLAGLIGPGLVLSLWSEQDQSRSGAWGVPLSPGRALSGSTVSLSGGDTGALASHRAGSMTPSNAIGFGTLSK